MHQQILDFEICLHGKADQNRSKPEDRPTDIRISQELRLTLGDIEDERLVVLRSLRDRVSLAQHISLPSVSHERRTGNICKATKTRDRRLSFILHSFLQYQGSRAFNCVA